MQAHENSSKWPELGVIDPQLAQVGFHPSHVCMNSLLTRSQQIIRDNPSLGTQSLADFPDIPAARKALSEGPPADLSGVNRSEIQIPVRDGSSIRALLYKPQAKPAAGSPLALTFHGGGWCIGTAEIEEFTSLPLVRQCHAVVVSVDYRLAPEHPFPTAIHDSWDALKWVSDLYLMRSSVTTFSIQSISVCRECPHLRCRSVNGIFNWRLLRRRQHLRCFVTSGSGQRHFTSAYSCLS
jgi:hypothetical protein